ncbi:corticotropin-releasing factor-binding protein isoform X2 [Folsomia candida]|uniref:corticotropin-releasing factor-binding protein isoform X2 n=1 Tax=Folsomia candida TaxID=158441 RepID=UPI001604C6E6|nr:corticotropin-releasing factor-binding protein isoform X2 [Folsomia candida]
MKMFGEPSIKLGICILVYFQTQFVLSFCHRIKTRSASAPQQIHHQEQHHPQQQNYGGGGLVELQESFPLQIDPLDLLSASENNNHRLPVPLPLSDILLPQQVLPQEQQTLQKNTFHVIDECVKITLEEGVYHFKSRGGSDQVCGLYLVSDPDKAIVIHVDYIDVRCQDKGLISVVDGWELNGEVFPSPLDHEKDTASRFQDVCIDSSSPSQQLQRTFTSSQNAALIQYRVPAYGQGFSIRVRHVQNPTPCNILVQDLEAVYKLENFGRRSNCSLTTLFDAKVRVLWMSAGEMATTSQCEKMGLEDYIQIGGSSGLDTSKMELIDEFCGHQNHPRGGYTTVFCGMTTLRLVSSGKYYNKIIAEVRRAEIDDLENASFICDIA